MILNAFFTYLLEHYRLGPIVGKTNLDLAFRWNVLSEILLTFINYFYCYLQNNCKLGTIKVSFHVQLQLYFFLSQTREWCFFCKVFGKWHFHLFLYVSNMGIFIIITMTVSIYFCFDFFCISNHLSLFFSSFICYFVQSFGYYYRS